MKTFQELLEQLDACGVARDWAAAKTIEEVVAECHRGDWLLWLAAQVNVDKRKITLAKAHCANIVRHLIKDERSLNAVDIAMSYGKGEVEHEALVVAAYAADVALTDIAFTDIDGYCYRVAAYAAYCAAAIHNSGCAAMNDIANAAAYMAAAFLTADIDIYSTSFADAAKSANQKQTADICREYIGQEIIEEVNEILNSKTI